MQSSNLRLLACERGGQTEGHILFLEGAVDSRWFHQVAVGVFAGSQISL